MDFCCWAPPGETKQTVEESLAFAESLHLDALKVSVGLRIYPNTALAARAVAEGIIDRNDDLLFPRFYMAPRCATGFPNALRAIQLLKKLMEVSVLRSHRFCANRRICFILTVRKQLDPSLRSGSTPFAEEFFSSLYSQIRCPLLHGNRRSTPYSCPLPFRAR